MFDPLIFSEIYLKYSHLKVSVMANLLTPICMDQMLILLCILIVKVSKVSPRIPKRFMRCGSSHRQRVVLLHICSPTILVTLHYFHILFNNPVFSLNAGVVSSSL